MFSLEEITILRNNVQSVIDELIGQRQVATATNNPHVAELEDTLRTRGSFPEDGALYFFRCADLVHVSARLTDDVETYSICSPKFATHPGEICSVNEATLALMFIFPNKGEPKFTVTTDRGFGRIINPNHARLLRYLHRKGFCTKHILTNGVDNIFIGGDTVANENFFSEVIHHTALQSDTFNNKVEQTLSCVFPDRTNWRTADQVEDLKKSYWSLSRVTSSVIVDTIDHLKALPNNNARCDYIRTIAS